MRGVGLGALLFVGPSSGRTATGAGPAGPAFTFHPSCLEVTSGVAWKFNRGEKSRATMLDVDDEETGRDRLDTPLFDWLELARFWALAVCALAVWLL